MAASGSLWAMTWMHPRIGGIGGVAGVIYGITLATMFAALHECIHRTAFASVRLNDAVAWLAGLLSFYNSTFYRYYHRWHHRYTQIPDHDPELSDPKPTHFAAYCLELSGLTWWLGKVKGHARIALGQMETYPFIPESARAKVIRSTRLQLLVYAVAVALSVMAQQPWFFLFWLLPLAMGQPFLRFILLAEHTGCSQDTNSLTNTRTTLTLWPIRFLMWNMPFHAEHHLYPSLPFHALPQAHQDLQPYLAHVAGGYWQTHRSILATFKPTQSVV